MASFAVLRDAGGGAGFSVNSPFAARSNYAEKRDWIPSNPCQVHDAERVLEALVRGAGVDVLGERQLMDVAQALERAGIDDTALVVVEADEDMNCVADLVHALGHGHILTCATAIGWLRPNANICSHLDVAAEDATEAGSDLQDLAVEARM